jgi:hypothetical protein
MPLIRRFASRLCLLLAFTAAARAQVVTATLLGQVRDTSGAVLSGAELTVKNIDRNDARIVTTDKRGEFVVSLLPVGHYAVSVRHKGFKELERSGIELHVGDQVTLTLQLEVGESSEVVTVTSAPALIQTQSAASEQLISGETIRELSINNRNFLQLLNLLPGVSNSATSDELPIGAVNPTGGVNSLSISLNGGRTTSNSYLIDGTDNLDRGANQTLIDTPSVDAVAEFKVVRGVYSAEYGRNASGQVNIITRSGTSTLHGSAYEFFRNDVLNANNSFNNYSNIARPELRYNDFGWTLGGPIFIPNHYNTDRSKTFFFYSQELRRIITYTTQAPGILPSAAMEQGQFTSSVCVAYASNNTTCTAMGTSIPQTSWSPVSAAYVKDIFSKLPQGLAANAYQVVSTGRNVFNIGDLLARIDHQINSHNNLTVRYMLDSANTQEPFGYQVNTLLPDVSNTATQHPGYNILARVTTVLRPTLLNEVAFALTSGRIYSVPVGLLAKANSPDIQVNLPYPSTVGNVPFISMSSLTRLSGYGPYDNHSRNYNGYDNVTEQLGRHTLKYGATYNYYQKTENNASTNAGSFSFTPASGGNQQSFANFLLGVGATFTQTSLDLTPDIRQNEFEFYFQDDFRWTPTLTINAGLRYSVFRVPVDAHHMLSNFDPAKFVTANAPTLASTSTVVPGTGDPLNGIIVNGSTSPYGNAVSNEPAGAFAPRIGFAWAPAMLNGKTAVRGGYGLVYDSTLVGIFENNIFTNRPYLQNLNVPNTSFANPANGTVTNGVSTSLPPLRATPLPARLPYTQVYSLDVQQQFGPRSAVDIGYYGAKGTHLLGIVDINALPPGYYYAQTGNNTALTSSTSPNANPYRPYLGYLAVNSVENWFGSNYNSLQVYYQANLKGGSRFTAAYTWAKAMTDASTDRNSAPQNGYNIHQEYAEANFSRRQMFVASYILHDQLFARRKGLLAGILKDWALAGTASFQAGLPTQVTSAVSSDPGQMGVLGASSTVVLRPDIVGDPNKNAPHTFAKWFNTAAYADVPAGQVRVGSSRATSFIGPGFEQWDISVFRTFHISNRWSAQFRVESFNTFNHTNPAALNDAGPTNENALFGRVTTVRDPRRIQLGAKVNF